MRETRRSLKAENTELRAKLAVHNHATRKGLHEHIKLVEGRNQDLVETIKKQDALIEALSAKIAAPAEQKAA